MSTKKILFIALLLTSPAFAQVEAQKIVPISGPPTVGCNSQANVGSVRVQNNLNNSNGPLFVCSKISAGTGATSYGWVNSNGGGGGGGGGGANTSLSNLSSVNINTSLLFQSGISLGSTTKPATDLFLVGSGAYGSAFWRLTGTPTGARTLTLPDVTGTLLTTASPITVPQGGIGITSGTSGGILYFTAPGAIASSLVLAQNQLILGGGPGVAPSTLGSLGTANQLLHGASPPSFSFVVNGDIANGTIDLTSKVTGILPAANGGTNNGFTQFSGPAGSLRTFGLPNVSANILTDNAPVSASQGGTGVITLTAHGVVIGQGSSPVTITAPGTSGQCFIGNGVSADPSFQTCPGGGAHNLLSSTHPDTTAASVARGDVITGQGASASWTRLAKGLQYQALNSGLSDVLWDAVHLDQAQGVTGILPGGNGGTANAFFSVSGPATSIKTFTFPNVSATILADNAAVTVSQGGTGIGAGTSGGVLYFSSTSAMASSALLPANGVVLGGGSGTAPSGTAAGSANQVFRVPGGGGAPAFGAVDLSQAAAVTAILGSSNGGTANAFTAISGPAGSIKTFTLPNATAAILTTNAAVTEVQGGTNQTSYAQGDILYASAANTLSRLAKDTTLTHVICNTGAGNNPAWCDPSIIGGGPPGVSGDIPRNNGAGAFAAANLNQNADGSINASTAITMPAASAPTYNAGGTTTCNLALSNACAPTTIATSGTTLALTNPHGAGPYWITWTQPGSSPVANPITFPGTMTNCPQPSPTAGKITTFEFIWTGSAYLCLGSNDPLDTPVTGPASSTANDCPKFADTSGKIISDAGVCLLSGAAAGGDLSGTLPNPTVSKVNGVSQGASPATHSIPVVTASNTRTDKVIPDCTDTGGNHINFTQSTDAFSCGTSGGAGGGITALTGDVTASGPGSVAATVAKVNGITYSATAAAHSIEVITTANTTATAKVIPDCTDTSGNHLNYTQSSDAFSCGTSSSGGGGGFPPISNGTYYEYDNFRSNDGGTTGVGRLNWAQLSSSGGSTLSQEVSSATSAGGFLLNTGASSFNDVALTSGNTSVFSPFHTAQAFTSRFSILPTTSDGNTIYRIGLSDNSTPAAGTPSNGVYIEKAAADSSWFAVCRASGTQTRSAALASVAAATQVAFQIRFVSSGTMGFKTASTFAGLAGATEVTVASNCPSASVGFSFAAQTATTASKSLGVFFYDMTITGLVY